MLLRKGKDTQSQQEGNPEDAALDSASWPRRVFERVSKIFGVTSKAAETIPRAAQPTENVSQLAQPVETVPPSAQAAVAIPAKSSDKLPEAPAVPERWVVFSDTDNDVSSVENTLWFAGIINVRGELIDNLKGVSIFHTGDLIDKKNPDPSVVEYWQCLQQDADTKGCHVKLIVGNHEQEIWQKISAGKKIGSMAPQADSLRAFIETLDLFHVAGPVLFIHGYPTFEFLRTLLHFKEVTGKDLNCFNEEHYRKAFRSINAMRQYAYVRENRKPHYLLYDVADASRYYKKKGRAVGAILEQLKIDVVIHGHRPQRSGVQVDYEFRKWIPKVRMIGNDTRVRRRGIGATIIKSTQSGALDMTFINTRTQSNKLRKELRDDFRGAAVASCSPPYISTNDPDIKSAAQG